MMSDVSTRHTHTNTSPLKKRPKTIESGTERKQKRWKWRPREARETWRLEKAFFRESFAFTNCKISRQQKRSRYQWTKPAHAHTIWTRMLRNECKCAISTYICFWRSVNRSCQRVFCLFLCQYRTVLTPRGSLFCMHNVCAPAYFMFFLSSLIWLQNLFKRDAVQIQFHPRICTFQMPQCDPENSVGSINLIGPDRRAHHYLGIYLFGHCLNHFRRKSYTICSEIDEERRPIDIFGYLCGIARVYFNWRDGIYVTKWLSRHTKCL